MIAWTLAALVAAAPLSAADNSFLYGTDKPNSAQTLNRHLSLLEHAFSDLIMVRYANDTQNDAAMKEKGFPQKPKTGYRFDRKQKYDQAWEAYTPALKALKAKPDDLKPAAAYAAKVRPHFRWVAEDYLKATAGGAGDAEKLTDFESDLMVSYLKWAPEGDYEKFKREWLSTVVPRSPEELYLLKERVSHTRAFLRAELKDYVAKAPSGVQDPAAQFSTLAGKSGKLLSGQKPQLDGFYAAAGMKYPERPAVSPTKPGETPKAFVYRFSDQEHAILTYVIAGAKKAEWEADSKAADADGAKAPALLAKWKGEALSTAQAYTKAPAPKVSGESARDFLTPFEGTYAEFRLKRADPALADRLGALYDGADEAMKKGDKGAAQRFADQVRPLIRADLKTYADSKGAKPDTKLVEWAKAKLTKDATFAALFPAPKDKPAGTGSEATPEEVKDFGYDRALEQLFSSPVERALVRHLIGDSKQAQEALVRAAIWGGDRAKAEADKWKAQAVALAKSQLDKPDAAVKASLDKAGLTEQDLLGYYCPQMPVGAASAGAPTAKDQLDAAAGMSKDAKGQSTDEGAAAAAGFDALRSSKLCADYLAAKKKEAALGDQPARSNLTFKPTEPPLKEAAEQKAAAKKNGAGVPQREFTQTDVMDSVAGAAGGFGVGAMIAMAVAAGPAGIITAGIIGAFIGFGLIAGFKLFGKK